MYKNYLEKPFVNVKSTFKHSEFGHDNNPNWRWTSQVSLVRRRSERECGREADEQWNPDEPIHPEEEATPPYYVLITTYLSYLLYIIIGHTRDFLGKRFYPKYYSHLMAHDVSPPVSLL